MTGSSRTLAVLGNLTIDELVSSGQLKTAPGGSALYVSATSALLGTTVDVISRVGLDYPPENLAWLRKRGVLIRRVTRTPGESCRFRLLYRNGFRTLHIVHQGTRLDSVQLDRHWEAIHIGPVFQEVPVSLIQACRRHTRLLSMDLQGFIRHKSVGGKVLLRPARLSEALSHIDLLKTTVEEALVQTRSSNLALAILRILENGPRFLIVTLGKRGSILARKKGPVIKAPAYPEEAVADPTGAGDMTVGAWLATFLATSDPLWSLCVGAGVSSLAVREKGLAKFRWSNLELFRRAEWVYARSRSWTGGVVSGQ